MKLKIFISVFFLFFVVSCQKKSETKKLLIPQNEVIYAKGFSIQTFDNFKKLIVHRANIGDHVIKEFYLVPKSQKIPDSLTNKKIIRTPIEKIVVSNTSHIPMLEAIGMEKKLIGFPNTHYISSLKTRKLIDIGLIQDLGNEQAMNIEILLNIKPDLLIGFGVDYTSKMYENIEKLGIPVIMNADWMEESPLGRAEWIKFFGILFEKDTLAKYQFKVIENNYLSLKEFAKKTKIKPSVLSGSLFQDVWYVAAGESFLAQMISDANAHYLWHDTKGTGSISLSLESVLEKGKHATYWIAPGNLITWSDFEKSHPIYLQFDALKKDKTYTYAHLKGKTGGLIYFEETPLRPDLVLQDLIQIFHPELKMDKNLQFFQKILNE